MQSMVSMAVADAPIGTLVESFVPQAIPLTVTNDPANASPPGLTILRI
jgi:hypothetical protein